jgi:hypothetical protein
MVVQRPLRNSARSLRPFSLHSETGSKETDSTLRASSRTGTVISISRSPLNSSDRPSTTLDSFSLTRRSTQSSRSTVLITTRLSTSNSLTTALLSRPSRRKWRSLTRPRKISTSAKREPLLESQPLTSFSSSLRLRLRRTASACVSSSKTTTLLERVPLPLRSSEESSLHRRST